MKFSLPLRLPFRLQGCSLAARLLRHGWYVAPPPLFVPDLYRRLLEGDPCADVLEVTTANGATSLPVDMRNSQFIAADRESFPDGYEPDVAAAIDLLLPDDGVFIDAGSNWGCFALLAALRPGFLGQVVAIEPAPRPANDLAALAAALDLPIQLLRLALGDADGEALLSQPVMTGGASLADPGAGIPVSVRRLDSLNLPTPDLIKLDVEGAELAAVRGASTLLMLHRPAIVLECRTDTPGGDWAAPLHLLAGHGYRILALEAAVDHAAGRCALTLTPMTPAGRSAWPQHLNILAIAEPDSLAHHPDRIA